MVAHAGRTSRLGKRNRRLASATAVRVFEFRARSLVAWDLDDLRCESAAMARFCQKFAARDVRSVSCGPEVHHPTSIGRRCGAVSTSDQQALSHHATGDGECIAHAKTKSPVGLGDVWRFLVTLFIVPIAIVE